MRKQIGDFRDFVFPKFKQAAEGGYSAIRYQARKTIYGVFTRGKAIPIQAWTGPEGPKRLRLPDFKTIGT